MPTASREYVGTVGCGDYDACIQARDSVVRDIRQLNTGERVANSYARVITSNEDLEDEGIAVEQATAVTGGRFPLLWLNITFDPAKLDPATLRDLEARHSLVLIGTAHSCVSYF
jgi:hypothetical protein